MRNSDPKCTLSVRVSHFLAGGNVQLRRDQNTAHPAQSHRPRDRFRSVCHGTRIRVLLCGVLQPVRCGQEPRDGTARRRGRHGQALQGHGRLLCQGVPAIPAMAILSALFRLLLSSLRYSVV